MAPITQDTLTPPKVCVVTKNEEHGKLYMGALRRQFDISLFADASQAGDEIAQARPDVILVETEITQGGRRGPRIAQLPKAHSAGDELNLVRH